MAESWSAKCTVPRDILRSRNDGTCSHQCGERASNNEGGFLGGARRWPYGGLRITVLQPLDLSGIDLTTRVSLSANHDRIQLRVGLSREQTGGYLSPVGETPGFQPAIVLAVARDERFVVRIGSQLVDDRYVPIRESGGVDILADILSSSDRLPMILIHVRSPESWDAARLLSSRLIGLVRVITLNHATSRLLANVMPPIDVPFGGAHLVWSEVSAQGVTLRADELAALGGEGVRARLMPRLAALSALARGIDDGWRAARQAAQDEALAEVGEQILRAKEDRNVEAELAALNSQTKQLRLQVNEWRDLAENEEIRANRFEALASEVDTARRESTYWRTQYQSLVDTAPASEIDPWSKHSTPNSFHEPRGNI